MKITSLLLIACALPIVAFADDASHKAAASSLLDLTNASNAMRSGFIAMIDPTIAGMKQRGIPEAGAEEVRAAMVEWFDKEIKWDEIKPKFIEVYTAEFSEQELKELAAFYGTPVGKKALVKLPAIMQKGAQIGQQYAMSKQELLNTKIKAILSKYSPTAAKPTP